VSIDARVTLTWHVPCCSRCIRLLSPLGRILALGGLLLAARGFVYGHDDSRPALTFLGLGTASSKVQRLTWPRSAEFGQLLPFVIAAKISRERPFATARRRSGSRGCGAEAPERRCGRK
jgi:hypothetical protein